MLKRQGLGEFYCFQGEHLVSMDLDTIDGWVVLGRLEIKLQGTFPL